MDKAQIQKNILRLLNEVEEEDVGISLLSTYHQSEEELAFFSDENRERVIKMIKKLSDDSLRHKQILGEIIKELTEQCNERS